MVRDTNGTSFPYLCSPIVFFLPLSVLVVNNKNVYFLFNQIINKLQIKCRSNIQPRGRDPEELTNKTHTENTFYKSVLKNIEILIEKFRIQVPFRYLQPNWLVLPLCLFPILLLIEHFSNLLLLHNYRIFSL